MKKLIISVLLLTSSSSFADFEFIQLLNFNGLYKSPEGRASAEKFIVPDFNSKKLDQALIDINISQQDNGYLLKYTDKEYLFENPPTFLQDVDQIKWKDIDLLSKQKRFYLDLPELSSKGTDGSAFFSKLRVECFENDASITSFSLKLIDGCTTNSTMSFSRILFNKTLRPIHILEGLKNTISKLTTDKSNSRLNNVMEFTKFSFSSKDNNFKLKLTAKTSRKVKVKMSGLMNFNKTTNILKIKINKAKSGFINIKNIIFKELKKQESETFKVQKPYIYIKLNNDGSK